MLAFRSMDSTSNLTSELRFGPLGLVLLALSLASLGCGSKTEEATPKATTSAAPQAPAATNPQAPGKSTFPAPSSPDPKPLAVGQWIRTVTRATAEPPSQTFVRVVGKEADASWVEIEMNTPTGTTVVQLLIDDKSRAGLSKSTIQKARMKDGTGSVQELSGATLPAISPLFEAQVALLGKPSLDKAERAEATTKAGSFQGCYVHEVNQDAPGASLQLKTWSHPAVPVSGFVRAEGTVSGKRVTIELLEMHEQGAKGSF